MVFCALGLCGIGIRFIGNLEERTVVEKITEII